VGKKNAETAVKVFNLYKDFFIQTEDSHLDFFVITILKFFDSDNRSLSLHSLVNEISENKDVFTSDTLIGMYPDRFNDEEFKKTYKPIKDEDIYKIKNDIKGIRRKLPVLQTLKDIRNKQVAHYEIEFTKLSFIPNEVGDLINAIQDVMNKISSRIEESETSWNNLKDGAIEDTNRIIENLHKGEQLRLKEIDEKYGIKK